MRPHILWFDESYTQELHHVDTIKDLLDEDYDALIVVGTALATSLANKIVMHTLRKDILTIDVNIESVCTVGHSIQVIEKSEKALPELFKSYKPKAAK